MKKIMDVNIVDTDFHYSQDNYDELIKIDDKDNQLYGWKNEKLTSQFCILSYEKELTNISYLVEDFVHKNKVDVLDSSNITIEFVRSVLAYSELPNPKNLENKITKVPKGRRKKSPDILYSDECKYIPPQTVQAAWLKANLPKDAIPGTYHGKVLISADELNENITLHYMIEIYEANVIEPQQFNEIFDVEFWQNPFAVAEYYQLVPFSKEHFEVLIPHMELYKKMGGDTITATIVEEAWAGQTYSEDKIKFPSMVKWIKNKKGKFEFDYTDFDKWIDFCKLMNIGDKITCFSLAPWTNSIIYFDEIAEKTKEFKLIPGSTEYAEIWREFLTDFIEHVEYKEIKDQIFVGIDERGFNHEIFDIIHSVTGTDGKPLKVSGALDSFVEKKELSRYITDLTVGTTAIKNNPIEFKELIRERKEENLRTTVYSCTGHIPGNFSLSEPMESYWTILFAYAVGGDGFLRWAYDSWVEDPLNDSSHSLFEAGDTFLVYPDEKNALKPKTKNSVRLEKILEGIIDIQKLDTLKKLSKEFNQKIKELLIIMTKNYEHNELYLNDKGKRYLQLDIQEFKTELNQLTEEALNKGYILTKDIDKDYTKIPKNIKKIEIPEENTKIIEKEPYTNRQYLGQPDMIMLNDEKTLLTVYPIGHGAGQIIMQMSKDSGENWIEKHSLPLSWKNSLETPTLYKLNFKSKQTKLMLITGRPNWHNNNKGGWDTSISLDEGITWSEFKNHHPLLNNNEKNYSMVAMSSLLQLKDENGEFQDRWLGVYHDENFINYKTYLTFNDDGTESWSKPEPYLNDYRIEEQIIKICEVCLFRSPDGKNITALARSQSHEHASVIFHSYDEGKNWSKPTFLPKELYGERHKAIYIPETKKLIITFREINLYKKGRNINWEAGNWVAWIGAYDDLIHHKPGELLITLGKDYTPSIKGGDTGYAGLVAQSDGTIITNSYGHWDKNFSDNWSGDVVNDLSYIKQVKFHFNEL